MQHGTVENKLNCKYMEINNILGNDLNGLSVSVYRAKKRIIIKLWVYSGSAGTNKKMIMNFNHTNKKKKTKQNRRGY